MTLQELIDYEVQSALDAALGDMPGGTITRHRLQTVLERMAKRVATDARNEVLMSLKSTEEVAELYGVSRQSINTRAARLREKRGSFGWKAGRGVWVFLPDEVGELKPGDIGRPPVERTEQ